MSSSQDEGRQQALSHHPQQDLVPPASRPSPPGDASMQDYVGSSHHWFRSALSGRGPPSVAVNSLARPCRPPCGEDCIQCVVRGTAVLWPGNWLGAVVLGTRRAGPHGLFTYTQCGDCGSQRRLRSHTNRQGLAAAAPRGRGTACAHGGENRNHKM